MNIKVVKKNTKALQTFSDKEWQIADKEHYGSHPDFAPKAYTLVAYKGKRIVGKSGLLIKAGVCEIQSLLIARSERGTGIGTSLMQRAETIAKKHNVHKIWLQTGRGWKAEAFYKKLGYRKSALLPKHYARQEFVIYDKFL